MIAFKWFFSSKRGLESITSVLVLLLMFAAMTGLIAFFLNSNLSAQRTMASDKELAQERIAITQVSTDNQQKIRNVTIANIGAIDVKIRAIYREIGGSTALLIDPQVYISQGTSKTLNIASLGLIALANSTLFAATERGTTSEGISEIQPAYKLPPGIPDTSALTIGPLMLSFNSLNWASSSKQGTIGTWQQKWTIPTGYCAWRLGLTNVDDQNRSLTLNKYSGFTLSRVSATQVTTWFMQSNTINVPWNTTQTATFLWDNPDSHTFASNAGNEQKNVNNVFLTVFGTYSDGQEFSETIPFQSIIVT